MLITLFYFTLGVGEVGVSPEKSGWDCEACLVKQNPNLFKLRDVFFSTVPQTRPKRGHGTGGGGVQNVLRTTLRVRD